MMDQAFFSTDILAYTIIGLCIFMVLFGLLRIIRVYSSMRGREHNFIDVHAIYDVFKQDVKNQAGRPDINADKLVMQEFYQSKVSMDQRYLN